MLNLDSDIKKIVLNRSYWYDIPRDEHGNIIKQVDSLLAKFPDMKIVWHGAWGHNSKNNSLQKNAEIFNKYFDPTAAWTWFDKLSSAVFGKRTYGSKITQYSYQEQDIEKIKRGNTVLHEDEISETANCILSLMGHELCIVGICLRGDKAKILTRDIFGSGKSGKVNFDLYRINFKENIDTENKMNRKIEELQRNNLSVKSYGFLLGTHYLICQQKTESSVAVKYKEMTDDTQESSISFDAAVSHVKKMYGEILSGFVTLAMNKNSYRFIYVSHPDKSDEVV